jgi:hypothetical protein
MCARLILLASLKLSMRRIQFIEIHEQPWFPSSIRDEITDALQFGFRLLKVYAPVIPRLQGALEATTCRSTARPTIVDLCSGGGGPWFHLSRKLQSPASAGETQGLQVWLTDKYPNPLAHKNVVVASENHVASYPRPVDAMNVPRELKGFRTMFTAFHHFPPEQARDVLQNAVDAGEGIGIFEITRRAPAAVGLVVGWVLFLFFATPWIRPFRWSRLLWTYVIPIIPVALIFDGVVSCLRTYRPSELQGMVNKLTNGSYCWEIGEHAGRNSEPRITYLIGYPQAPAP